MNYGNNHTHLHKYQGKWYLFYQANNLEASIGSTGGFRSIYVDEIEVDEDNVVIRECTPSFKGVRAIKNLDPYTPQYAATAAATLGIVHEQADGEGHMVVKIGTPSTKAPIPSEGVIEVRNVEFSGADNTLKCLVKGNGSIALRIDSKDGEDIATITSLDENWTEQTAVCNSVLNGVHTIYFILSGDVLFDKWVLSNETPSDIEEVQSLDTPKNTGDLYNLKGQLIHKPAKGIYVSNGKKYIISDK